MRLKKHSEKTDDARPKREQDQRASIFLSFFQTSKHFHKSFSKGFSQFHTLRRLHRFPQIWSDSSTKFREISTLVFFSTVQQKSGNVFLFFRAHRTDDLTKKLGKVGPFECDELEKHCRVSAECYPTKVPALYRMAKEKFNSAFLVLLLVSRQTKSQMLVIDIQFR